MYDDIINFDYKNFKKMKGKSNINRAAQFAPFSALVGYNDNITELTRYVENELEINEEQKIIINEKLMLLNTLLTTEEPEVIITHFVKDKIKDGGEYKIDKNILLKIDNDDKVIKLKNGININMENIINLEF